MINSQTRDRRGGHKTTPLASQRGTVGFTPEERDLIKRQGRRAQRRESKVTLADAKQQYWEELDLQDAYLYDGIDYDGIPYADLDIDEDAAMHFDYELELFTF